MASQDFPGRAIGLDFGTKRLGIALSDEKQWAVRPFVVYRRVAPDTDYEYLAELVRNHEACRVVVGVPKRLSGEFGPAAARAGAFIEGLRVAVHPLVVEVVDEALTSWAADERMRAEKLKPAERKQWRDAYAAAVILEEALGLLGRVSLDEA